MAQDQIAEDIYAYLQSQAVPLEDDINSVLRRLLGLDGSQPNRPVVEAHGPSRSRRSKKGSGRKRERSRAPKGSMLPEESYELPLLTALQELGGRAPTSEVIDRVGELLEGELTAVDRETVSSGDTRWRNRTQFIRLSLIKKGEMKEGSPRGLWEISERGRERLRGAG